MNRDAELRCRCGEVTGLVAGAAPETVNRLVCYCDDCQAFMHHLDRRDLLDAKGGTDIVQVAPGSITFTSGGANLEGVRLGPKGLYRFYARCCNTPLGNTVGPKVPFVGLPAQAFDRADEVFGPPLGGILGKYAVGGAPAGSTGLQLPLLARMVVKFVGWRLRGKAWPHPYFDRATRAPSRPVTVLPADARAALRAFCGPEPTATPPR